MKTAIDRIKFAIRLAKVDLQTLRPGDWLNLRDDLAQFSISKGGSSLKDLGGIRAVPLKEPLPGDYTENDFLKLQKDMKNLLAGVSRISTEKGAMGAMTRLGPVDLNLSDPFGYGEVFVSAQGSTRDMFLLQLLFLLRQEGVENLMTCPECGEVFFREDKRQKYCKRGCSNLASVKRFHRKAKKGRKK